MTCYGQFALPEKELRDQNRDYARGECPVFDRWSENSVIKSISKPTILVLS